MRDRFVRTIVFFDLPNVHYKDKRSYILFRRFLLNEGFIMMQESVYSKICLNSTQSDLLYKRLNKNAPKKGIIQILTITEKQYAAIKYITGMQNGKVIDSESRLVVL